MIELRLLDGTRLDLTGDEIIAITYAVNDIASIQTRQGVTSNEFELPITDFNLKALGYPTNFNVNQNVNPFKQIPAEIYEEELRIAKGYIQITNPSISRNVIPYTFFGENAEWFNLIKGRSIRQLDLSEFNHVFNPTTITSSFTRTDGYKYSLIDRNGLNFLTGNILSSQCFTINTFQSSIVKAIIEGAGFKVKGSLLSDPLYKSTLIPDTNNKFYALNSDSGFIRDVYVGNKSTSYPSGIETTIDFELTASTLGQFNKDGNNFNISTDTYTADSGMLASVFARFSVSNQTTSNPTDVTIRLKKNGTAIATITETGVLAGTIFSFVEDLTLDANDTLEFTIEPSTEDVVINQPKFVSITDFTLVNYLSIQVEDIALEGSVINLNATLPDIDQADFLKDVVFDHNVLVTVNLSSKEITLDLKKYNVDNSIDWSNIIDLSEKVEINYTSLLENYARINDVKRTQDDGAFIDRYNGKNNIKFGDGQILLNNDFLPSRETLFQSVFAPTQTINSLNGNQPLPYIYGEEISEIIEIDSFDNDDIIVLNDADLDSFLKDTPDNSIWALITDSSTADRNHAYSVVNIVKTSTQYVITVNDIFAAAAATGLLRLIKREEESQPRKLLDGGNFDIADLNETYTDYTVKDVNTNTSTFTTIPYLYFWNPTLGLPTDALIDSLSYGNVNINSRCENLLDRYYPETIRLLKSGKVLRASFRLNQNDIFNLNFNKLVFLNFYLNGQTIQGYFIINKIEEYTGNADSTVVELIKI